MQARDYYSVVKLYFSFKCFEWNKTNRSLEQYNKHHTNFNFIKDEYKESVRQVAFSYVYILTALISYHNMKLLCM